MVGILLSSIGGASGQIVTVVNSEGGVSGSASCYIHSTKYQDSEILFEFDPDFPVLVQPQPAGAAITYSRSPGGDPILACQASVVANALSSNCSGPSCFPYSDSLSLSGSIGGAGWAYPANFSDPPIVLLSSASYGAEFVSTIVFDVHVRALLQPSGGLGCTNYTGDGFASNSWSMNSDTSDLFNNALHSVPGEETIVGFVGGPYVLNPGRYTSHVGGILQTTILSQSQSLSSNSTYAILQLGFTPLPACDADIAGAGWGGPNGLVNIDDLLAIINAWGGCAVPPATCPADIAPFGGNGIVNIDDLLAVINGWGSCPE
jgi:hypothetical protein